MFIQYLNNKGSNFIFFEPHSIAQMLETIEIIKKIMSVIKKYRIFNKRVAF